ncbi:hypothetical protein NW762_001375 [Fusarium torreyae]|uniref:DUF7730 domain-containing protein n=1 Tax=Fusarium torreyae TaxID=1237075 RepID=A0A9W8VLH1_9HYPO|nr:hypothetical protein NW762_001375 [Fusarium torreyae]
MQALYPPPFYPTDDIDESPLFTQLNADVRRLIYLKVFSSSRVVVAFRAHGDPPSSGPRGWMHYECQEGSALPPDDSIATKNPNRLQGTSLLFSCQKVYAEAVWVLYPSITMVFDSPDLFCFFNRCFQSKVGMLRSCEFYCAVVPKEQDGASDLNLLTRALRNRSGPLRVRIRVYNPSDFDGAFVGNLDNAVAQQTVQAIKCIMSMEDISGSISLPSQLEKATRSFAHEHSARFSLIFHTDYMHDSDGSEMEEFDMGPYPAVEESDQDDQGSDFWNDTADYDDEDD